MGHNGRRSCRAPTSEEMGSSTVSAKKMGTHALCERCKWRDEQDYRNLDDREKKFLILMMGDFKHEMIMPEEFLWRFKGEFPTEIKLETRNGYTYNIGVAKNQEKLVLTAGWEQFVEKFDLQMGDSIVFRYNGNSQFNVIIFDKLGREKALTVVVYDFQSRAEERHPYATETVNCFPRHSQPMQTQCPDVTLNSSYVHQQPMQMQSPPLQRQPRLQREKSSQRNWATLNHSYSESSGTSLSLEDCHKMRGVPNHNYIVRKMPRLSSVQKEQLKDGYITTHKTKLNPVQKEELKEKIQSIHSDIPLFVAVMVKANVVTGFTLTIPKYYADKYLGDEQSICLQRHFRNWEVRFYVKHESVIGWRNFVEDNNMKLGDICLFQRLIRQRCTMEVHIIRVNDGNIWRPESK